MDIHLWLTFFGASLLISISPGAGAITTISNGIRYGLKDTLPGIAGLQLGYAMQVIIVGVGLGALLASSVVAFQVVKWLGIGYLVYLGYKKFTEQPQAIEFGQNAKQSAKKQFFAAALINLTNPKVTVFLVAFFPQFLDVKGDLLSQYLILGSTVVLADCLVMLGYAILASRLSNALNNQAQQRIQNKLFGGLYMGVAGVMAAA
ncbi:homoserine/homoserine lactone efflux protein [Vibrio sp. WXL103]|uniref:homoserine/homoserine lactone efflux protein n=1 Tax=unclassified Vibrio TaxID=2614977 RepID=UPI003EC74518